MKRITECLIAGALASFTLGSTDRQMNQGFKFANSFATIQIDQKGSVFSIHSRATNHEFSAKTQHSPILSLEIDKQIIMPISAKLNRRSHQLVLKYPNGSIATIQVAAHKEYFRFQLVSLTHRARVDNVVWGPIKTTISKIIGDLIGVVRQDDFAIGMVGLDDNTIPGPPVDGDCYGMGYFIHSPDPKKIPLPAKYKEGQWFNIGGDGVSDTAFYSHPEEFFQQVMGNGAKLEPSFGSSVTYHARNRRKSTTHFFSLLPGFKGSRPRHQISDPVDVDYIGSAVALFACPDMEGLKTIEKIELAEGVPHPVIDGKWIHDRTGDKPDMAWYGPHDKLIEYADQLGLQAVQDEGQGEYYANPADHWKGQRVGFADGRKMTYPEFTRITNQHGVKYGLHTLCLFLQAGRCTDVTPKANVHLQTVLRTKLAKSISASDTQIEVTDPSFLAEDGTWPMRDGANTLRIGNELLTYTGVSQTAPFMLLGIKRGQDGTTAVPHEAKNELVKLQMNCYNGFVPDMSLMPSYADYYAKVMVENGMKYIDFDGLESCVYQNHGYFGVRKFLRRLFETYAKLTGGQSPRVMGSCVFPGGWEFMSVCNIGGGNNMFDPVLNKWGIEGKDIRNAFGNSYFAVTFGIQDYHSDWSLYDAENLEAKSIGWNAMYMLGLSEHTVEQSGEKRAIFRAFRTWENARHAQVFKPAVRAQLKDMNSKFHLEQLGTSFFLSPVKEIRKTATSFSFGPGPLHFSLQFMKPVDSFTLQLGGGTLHFSQKVEAGQFLLVNGDHVTMADSNRKPTVPLPISSSDLWLSGNCNISVQSASPLSCEWTIWTVGKPQKL